jgi:hypothetical protein
MSKYIFQLRRGWKWDSDPMTGEPRDDWATYEAKEDHMKPFEGELVLEYDNGVPRLKIGDGVSEFSQLSYMSVDSFLLPKSATVTIKGGEDAWIQARDDDGNPISKRYYQVVTIQNAIITNKSKVDLQPSPEQLVDFHDKDIAFTTVNEDGQVRVCVIGQRPMDDYTMKVTVTEVDVDG